MPTISLNPTAGTIFTATPGAGDWVIDCRLSGLQAGPTTLKYKITVGGFTLDGYSQPILIDAGETTIQTIINIHCNDDETVVITVLSSNSNDIAVTYSATLIKGILNTLADIEAKTNLITANSIIINSPLNALGELKLLSGDSGTIITLTDTNDSWIDLTEASSIRLDIAQVNISGQLPNEPLATIPGTIISNSEVQFIQTAEAIAALQQLNPRYYQFRIVATFTTGDQHLCKPGPCTLLW